MIQNLNQISFRSYGSVLPEHARGTTSFPKEDSELIRIGSSSAPIYRAQSDTWIAGSFGAAILSVCSGDDEYLHFYLDKPVIVNKGVQFALSAFKGIADISMYCEGDRPELLGSKPGQQLRQDRKLHVDGIYTFFYQEKEQGFLFPGESHPMPEITYVDQGSIHSVVDGQDLLLKQGELVIYGSNQWHMQYSDIGVAPRFVTISFDVTGTDLAPLLNRKFAAPQAVASLLRSMLQEEDRADAFSTDIVVSELTLLLLYLLREADTPTGSKVKNTNIAHNENEIIRQAQQYVAAHIREKLSVPIVAAKVGVSPSYLTVLFHKNLQLSPGEYIRRTKLQESKQMIRENNLNFTQIAAILQYSTVHHFSRQFKDKFGITPSEYAKSVR